LAATSVLRCHGIRLAAIGLGVLCDESGHIKFPFSYLAHVTLLTSAQVRLRIDSGLLIVAAGEDLESQTELRLITPLQLA